LQTETELSNERLILKNLENKGPVGVNGFTAEGYFVFPKLGRFLFLIE